MGRTVVTLAAAIALAAACSEAEPAADPELDDRLGESDIELSGDPIEPHPDAVEPHLTVIFSTEAYDEDSDIVTFSLAPEPCGVLHSIEVDQARPVPTVGVYVGYLADEDGARPVCDGEDRVVGAKLPDGFRVDPDVGIDDLATR